MAMILISVHLKWCQKEVNFQIVAGVSTTCKRIKRKDQSILCM